MALWFLGQVNVWMRAATAMHVLTCAAVHMMAMHVPAPPAPPAAPFYICCWAHPNQALQQRGYLLARLSQLSIFNTQCGCTCALLPRHASPL